MNGKLTSLSQVIILCLCCLSLLSEVTAHECHREEQFVQVKQDGLPLINSIKTVTASKRFFCSTECLSLPGCNSFAFLTVASTDNCQLSTSVDGVSVSEGVEAVIYKKVVSAPNSCDPNPCQNGGTCLEYCYPPFYLCNCRVTAEGKHCEWDLKCFEANWGASFDHEGKVECTETTNYLAGIRRAGCEDLLCIEAGLCCPMPLAFSKGSRDCVTANWENSFGHVAGWNNCPERHFLIGFYRSGTDQKLGNLEHGVCCKPSTTQVHEQQCYDEDIVKLFDEANLAKCTRPKHYITAIYTAACSSLYCIDYIKCCRM